MKTKTDGQTEMTKLTVTFRNFANAPKNGYTMRTRFPTVCITQRMHLSHVSHTGRTVTESEVQSGLCLVRIRHSFVPVSSNTISQTQKEMSA
jgi:flagellar basal body rod protein FlgG